MLLKLNTNSSRYERGKKLRNYEIKTLQKEDTKDEHGTSNFSNHQNRNDRIGHHHLIHYCIRMSHTFHHEGGVETAHPRTGPDRQRETVYITLQEPECVSTEQVETFV